MSASYENEPAARSQSEAPSVARTTRKQRKPKGKYRLAREEVRSGRRLLGALTILAPGAFFVIGDIIRRGEDILRFNAYYRKWWVLGALGTLVFWSIFMLAASRRRGFAGNLGGVLFLVVFGMIASVQGAFFAVWNLYLNLDGQIHSQSMAQSLIGHLPLYRPIVIFHFVVGFGCALLLVRSARKYLRSSIWLQLPFLLVMLGGFYAMKDVRSSYGARLELKPGAAAVRVGASLPDLQYIHSVVGAAKEIYGFTNDSPDRRVQRRSPIPLPKLVSKNPVPRNVVLIVQESQRGDVTCNDYDPACDLPTPFTNAAAPGRFGFNQMRALDSTTAISISTIWSGMLPVESFETLHAAPLVWEYAKAAGYTTAYWTTQHAMFGNIRLYVQDLPLDHFISSTQLDRQSDPDVGAYDSDLADHVIKEWHKLKEPFFVVVHPSNVHYPYVYDERYAPFQPASFDKSAEKNAEFWNYYKNVVYLSDLAMGRIVDHIRSTDAGERTVILYTGDHGEAFREHWQLGHTSSLFDEETRVPGWIDAPPGTLSVEEEQNLRKAKDEFVYHVDLLPTMLDLMGLWDDPAIDPFKVAMWGHPLTRPDRTVAALPMTNCSWVWECAFRNWGMTQGPMKLSAREWDNEYKCFNVLDDPEEQNNLGEAACGVLPELARGWFGSMPKETPPGRVQTDWGR